MHIPVSYTHLSFKREHMAPGEMEKIVIPKAFLDKVENGEITVSVEKVGA